VTFTLALTAMVLSVLIGVPAGIISALKPYSLLDYVVMVLALVGVSMPVFWLGLMLQMAIPSYSIGLEGNSWFPAVESLKGFSVWDWLAGGLWKLSLPGFCLSTIPMAIIARMTRSNMLEVLNLDYIRTAWAKGLSGRAVIVKHALRNSLMPVITVIGLNFAYLLAGAILTETVFSIPGLGSLMIGGILVRDFPVVMGGTVFIALAFVTVNLIVDIVYALVNPRIKLS
jgi:peptide/nickel transport system permease protein